MSLRYIPYAEYKYNTFIHDFKDEYAFLDWNYQTEFLYMGKKYNCVLDAYNDNVEDNFSDEKKIKLMGDILFIRFKLHDADKLLALDHPWIEKYNDECDNFWNSCTCLGCLLADKNNYYGLLLMEVRLYIKHLNKKSHKIHGAVWKPRYFK